MMRLQLTLLLLFCVTTALAVSADNVSDALASHNLHAPVELPILDNSQLERLLAGDMILLRERKAMAQAGGTEQDRIRVVGYQLVKRPRLLVWLGALDIQSGHSNRLTEHLIDHNNLGGSLWYQHLDTPWPVRDRHWVIRNTKSTDLNAITNGLVWEHRWQLEDNGQHLANELLIDGKVAGLNPKRGQSSIYLVINRGAWTMFELDHNTTLVVAHTAAVMGGWVPNSLVIKFVRRQLGSVLQGLTARADAIHEHYTGAYPVFDGSGKKITPQMASAENERYRQSK